MPEIERIFERIDGYREEVIRLQSALTSRIALGPENGGSGEHEKADFVKDLLRKAEPDVLEEYKAPDSRAKDGYRPNLIAKWGSRVQKPAVWVLSHLDIVPPGDFSLWQGDPYEVRVEGDQIFGRGVEDNQHGLVSPFLALKALLASGEDFARPIGLAAVADEETGSRYGLQYLLSAHPGIFAPEDLIVVPDGGNEEGTMIEVAEKSMLWIRFTVSGRQCHASTPDKGRNSLVAAARLIVALEELVTEFGDSDPIFRPPGSTFQPTKIEGNVPNVNTIPGRDVFYLDCRILPRYSIEDVLAAVQAISAEVGSELGVDVEVETAHRQDAAPQTPGDAPVVKALAGAVKTVTGKTAEPMGIGGGTVAAFFREAGLPAAVWSTISDTAHQPNEYALISNILTDAKIFACLYLDSAD